MNRDAYRLPDLARPFARTNVQTIAQRAGLIGELLPAARAFAPELVIISAGFDSRHGDPLGGLQFTDDCFAKMTRLAAALAPPGRVVSVLEGGYSLQGLASACAAHVAALMPESQSNP